MKNIIFIMIVFILAMLLIITACKPIQEQDVDTIIQEGKEQIKNITKTIEQKFEEENKVLFIVAPENFRDEELFTPKEILEENGYNIIIASRDVELAKGMLGARVNVNIDITEVNINNYLAIVVIGGSGASVYFDDITLHNILKQAFYQNKTIAAICLAPAILANAGLLNNKKATSFSTTKKILKEHGAITLDEPVVVDGNIITANGPDAAYDFGNTILNNLENMKD